MPSFKGIKAGGYSPVGPVPRPSGPPLKPSDSAAAAPRQPTRDLNAEVARLNSEVADLQTVVSYLLRLEGTTRNELRQHAFVQARRRGLDAAQAASESRETWRRLLLTLNWQDENHAEGRTPASTQRQNSDG